MITSENGDSVKQMVKKKRQSQQCQACCGEEHWFLTG